MFGLLQGDCEHCGRTYRYSLLHSGFGDCSYAYCDTCGALATFTYSSSSMVSVPPISVPHQVIDSEWEPFLRPCGCGGRFRRGASPRCLFCHASLSAEHAASHIERNSAAANRRWHWQGNWTDLYALSIEDPRNPGSLRQVIDPFALPKEHLDKPPKGGWRHIFSHSG